MFQISVLGPIEVRRDGSVLSVPGGKTSELLVRLALEAGVPVRTDRLVDELWADGAVNTRRNTLQSKIAKLRRAFGEPGVIVTGRDGYALAVESSAVDALVVVHHAAAASRLLEEGEARRVDELSTSALALFSGDVLQGAGGGDWVSPHRARLEEARMRLVETQVSARLRFGDEGDVIGELEAAVATYPFQESLWDLLITALYRAGRQADALATYQRVRTLLADELGLDPGPQLQQLEQRVLAQDESLVLDREPRATGARPLSGNLPSISAELVGRDQEVSALGDALAEERLIEIVGPGGVGKTAVAIAAGRALRSEGTATGGTGPGGLASGGVWLARLETARTRDDVIDVLVAAMHVTGGEPALLERLRGASALIILDNCEQVVDTTAELAVRLLDAAPDVRILCTSQVPLGIDGEVLFELEPLELADAVALFTRRAIAQRKNQSLSESDATVNELCRSLDGLPLAIELAAARTRTLSIAEINRRLDDRFNVLRDPTSRRPERRRALKATIRWSYELLFPDDKRGLWALSTFAGGAPMAAVEFVLAALEVPASAAIDVVSRLANRSLVIVDDEGSALPTRYRLLDSIRAFAVDAMDDAGLTDRALAAHARWFADQADASTAGVRSGRQAEYLDVARVERANIDAALTWATEHDPRLALDIVNGFGWAWVVLGDSRGAQRLLTALDAVGDGAPPEARADALLLAAWIEASTGRLELAREHIAVASDLADAIDDVDLRARCCYYLAYVVSHRGEFRHALSLTDRSDSLYKGLDRSWDQAANWLFASRAAISAGDEARAIDALDHVQRWLSDVDDPWLHVRYEANLGELARIQHRFDDAVFHLGRAAERSRELGFLQTEAYQLSSLGRAQCQAGDYETGAATLELAIRKAEATGDLRMAALGRVHLGRVLRALGQTARARVALALAADWHRAAGGGEQAALGECLLAAMDAEAGVPDAAVRLEAILEESRGADQPHVEVFALDALARIAADDGDLGAARALRAEADRRMHATAHFVTDRDRTDAYAVGQIA